MKEKEKRNVYQEVTNRIIEQLEKGVVPWQKPWTGSPNGAFNRITKRPYSLLNQMSLGEPGEYASFKQWRELGGSVKKGKKARHVVFWKIFVKKESVDGMEKEIHIPVLREFPVFHISQTEGIEPLDKGEIVHNDPIEECEEIKIGYSQRENIKIRESVSDRAYYSSADDYISIPAINQFPLIEEYYSTLFHEMTHSTGHKSRLNRLTGKNISRKSEEYSKEELVAEIGAASLCNLCGIETEKSFKNSAAYIASWIKVLKSDNKFIVSAASKAEKAVRYILNGKEAEECEIIPLF